MKSMKDSNTRTLSDTLEPAYLYGIKTLTAEDIARLSFCQAAKVKEMD